MAKKKVDRDPPQPGRAATVEAERVDPEHPKRSLPPVTLSARPLAETVEQLERLESLDAPVVSVYWSVPADLGELKGAVSKLKDLAKPVQERAKSLELSHGARMSLRADAGRILELEPLVPKLHGRTLALFRCSQQDFEEATVVPGGLPDSIHLDATPFTRPLLSVLDESHRYAVVVVDREHGWLFDFYLGVLEGADSEHDRVLRNSNFAAGDKEFGVRHKEQELVKHHYREVADALNRMVQDDGVELVVVGGHEDNVPHFLNQLPSDLRQKVVGTFVIDPHTLTPALARVAAQGAVDEYERREEEHLVNESIERVASGSLGAIGLPWCLVATNELGVEHLLVQPGVTIAGRVCDSCGWVGLSHEECPIDGRPTRETPDLIDEMATRVLGSSGHVEHIYADTPLRYQLVAALLRFPVPRPDQGQGENGGGRGAETANPVTP